MPLLWVIRRFTGDILGSRSRDDTPRNSSYVDVYVKTINLQWR
jgi:hypothetical protein